ncbi:MAG TPA: hypothetical protein VIR59_07555 [Gaiellaceae bacterium]
MRRRPIGQILVEQGEISETDLEAALAEQERSGRRLGEILIEQGRTSWLALARAIAEQVLDIQSSPVVPEPKVEPAPDPVKMVRELAERVASLPPVPDPLPPPAPAPAHDAEHELARAVAEQVANLDAPSSPQPPEARLLRLTPAPQPPAPIADDDRLTSVEALLRERQRAFIELVTTAETLRMKVARLEEILEERDRELAKLRIARAV